MVGSPACVAVRVRDLAGGEIVADSIRFCEGFVDATVLPLPSDKAAMKARCATWDFRRSFDMTTGAGAADCEERAISGPAPVW